MSTRHVEFDDLLRVLDESGCLRHVLLIGSWAEYLYEATGVLEGYHCAIRTLDIDVLVRNQRLPSPPASVTTVAREHGYLVSRDVLTDTTKLRHPSGLEVEFLLGKVGAGTEASLKTNIGVVAQTLRHLDILQREPLTVGYDEMAVGVRAPRRTSRRRWSSTTRGGARRTRTPRRLGTFGLTLTPSASLGWSPRSRGARGCATIAISSVMPRT